MPATPVKPARTPRWVPQNVTVYLSHVADGRSLRRIAREKGCHPSTVLRQVRQIEVRRDDLLVDQALDRIGALYSPQGETGRPHPKDTPMTMTARTSRSMTDLPCDATVAREARRILRRLSEPGACLAVATDMEKAVVVRDGIDGTGVRTAVVDRSVAEAMALKEWIVCATPGRISRYRISAAGRAALKVLIADEEAARAGDAQPARHREIEERSLSDGKGGTTRVRYNAAESPLAILARRRDKDGQPFLTPRMVAAGERLREDFEISQMGPRVTQNWDRFLTTGDPSYNPQAGAPGGGEAARNRVMAALAELGPGLGDVALRCCCFLEGLEVAERRMGWSARSGKVVLRIALHRLVRHYDATENGWSPLIG